MEQFKTNSIVMRVGFNNIEELQDAFNKTIELTRKGITDYTENKDHHLNFTAEHNLIHNSDDVRQEVIDGKPCFIIKSSIE